MTYQPSLPELQAAAEGAAAWQGRPRGFYRRAGKRLFDLAVVVIFAVPVAMVVAVLATLVMLDGGKPFFGHSRVGRGGRTFRCWKLRTMVPDAEARLAAHLAADPRAAEEWAATQKLRHDPRVTLVGRLLRRTSLDELPQVWNVLVGDMSLVGPRPVTPEELERYGRHRAAYCSLRPGITGLWQVRGRNDVSYAARVAMDADYARHASLALDVGLVLGTVPAVLRLTGR